MLIFLLFYSLCSFASEDHVISMYDNTVNIKELKEALKGSGKQYLLDECDSIEKKGDIYYITNGNTLHAISKRGERGDNRRVNSMQSNTQDYNGSVVFLNVPDDPSNLTKANKAWVSGDKELALLFYEEAAKEAEEDGNYELAASIYYNEILNFEKADECHVEAAKKAEERGRYLDAKFFYMQARDSFNSDRMKDLILEENRKWNQQNGV